MNPFRSHSKLVSKAAALGAAMAVVGLIGVAQGQQQKSATAQIMMKINKQGGTLKKAMQSPGNFSKARTDVVASAEELAKLGKEARAIKDNAQKAKDVNNADETWNSMADNLIRASDSLARAAGEGNYDQAKIAQQAIGGSCMQCHTVFRKRGGGR